MYTKAMRPIRDDRGAVSLVSMLAVLSFALLAAFAGGIYFFLRNEASEKAAREAAVRAKEAVAAATPGMPRSKERSGYMDDFTLPDQNGVMVSLKQISERRPVLLYIFSPFCGHCSGRLTEFSKFIKDHPASGFALVGVLWQGSPDRARTYLSRTGLPGPLLSDKEGVLCGRLGVGEFTVFVLDKQLAVRYRGEMPGLETAMATVGR